MIIIIKIPKKYTQEHKIIKHGENTGMKRILLMLKRQ
jgi:hypothetical protein